MVQNIFYSIWTILTNWYSHIRFWTFHKFKGKRQKKKTWIRVSKFKHGLFSNCFSSGNILINRIFWQIQAATIDDAKIILNKLNKGKDSLIDFLSLLSNSELYSDIQRGKKALLINKVFWSCVFHVVKDLFEDDREYMFYYGKESISSGVMTLYYNNTFSYSDRKITDILYVSIFLTLNKNFA